ncbi:TetR family transcriptional regulator [Panacagrimonas perspica]|uniref:TetR family transcriptional regulator n=1 Tax=Panacagrimonas perspica TaxID=381431 RepID=A0A4V3URB3_9GAMM|nr:TetR/AcrR family transcriptional regulator [Panacagrimonas perspica]TDU28981.1 TetR family transcriptional regulator [Panacagrimonas perspica]THD02201.1 TetR family transcriptional regulator [Panacagrimonas perspica]
MKTAPSRKEATHARIVDTAARAIRRAGYDGVGVADIMKAAGLTHGGFYAHFASRDALIVEAIEQAGCEGMQTLVASIERREARGATPFKALVSAYLSDTHLGSVETGCPIAVLVGEMPRQSDAVQAATRRRVQAFIEMVRARLPGHRAADEAETVASTLIGTLQIARALGDTAPGRAFLSGRRRHLLASFEPGED